MAFGDRGRVMIGRLRGILLSKKPPVLVIEAAGVGYELLAPMPVFFDLPATGQEVVMHTHLAIRDDAHVLYGFRNLHERDMFRQLIKVTGIGPKLALAVMSGMSNAELVACVQAQDAARLARVPGVGKKTAERLCMELQDKLEIAAVPLAEPAASAAPAAFAGAAQQAAQALVSLGYKTHEIDRLLRGIDTARMDVEQIIRAALQAAVTA